MEFELKAAPSVLIIMGTYNGEKYIAQQLDSIIDQTYHNWRLVISDDGSSDGTLEIVRQYQKKFPIGRVIIKNGPRKGFCANFLSVCLDCELQADYYAFCDQDDVWKPEKLEIAIAWFQMNDKDISGLYCGRTTYISETMKEIGWSREITIEPSFSNALVQCIAGGNTMVFNDVLRALVLKAGNVKVPSHDWWLYILCTASDGLVKYDKTPYILYRQHSASLVGSNLSFSAQLKRVFLGLNGSYSTWNSQHISALRRIESLLSIASVKRLNKFDALRNSKLVDRIGLVFRKDIYRSGKLGELMLFFAAVLRKL